MKHQPPQDPGPLFESATPRRFDVAAIREAMGRPDPKPVDPNIRADDRDRLSTQCRVLLAALLRGERLTPLSASESYGVLRLAARVWDLRQAGYAVKSERDPVTKCEVYWLEIKP